MNFSEPLLISAYIDNDLLEVTIIRPEFFFSNKTLSFIEKN